MKNVYRYSGLPKSQKKNLQKKGNFSDMRWNGHDLTCRKPTDNITTISLRWTPEGQRKQGRPKTTQGRTRERVEKGWPEKEQTGKEGLRLGTVEEDSGCNKDQVGMQVEIFSYQINITFEKEFGGVGKQKRLRGRGA